MRSKPFPLPPRLTAVGLKRAFRNLLVGAHSDSDYHLVPALPVLNHPTALQIDTRTVEVATPEGVVCYLALRKWLTMAASGNPSLDLTIRGDRIPPVISSGSSRSTATNLLLASHWKNLGAPSVEAELSVVTPNGHAPPASTAALREVASGLLAGIGTLYDTYLHDLAAQQVLAEFLSEALANVAEHARAEGAANSDTVEMWLSCGVQSIAERREEVIESCLTPKAMQRWLAWLDTLESPSILRVAVADIGIGVPGSLGNTFLENHEYDRNSLARDGRTAVLRLHDSIIKWAFTTDGTRKRAGQYATPSMARGWRGLHQLIQRARSLNASLILSSGFGAYGALGSKEEAVVTRLEYGGPEDRRAAPWPWTCLSLELPLPLSSMRPITRDMCKTARRLQAAVGRFVCVSPGTRDHLTRDDRDTAARLGAYVDSVTGEMGRKLAGLSLTDEDLVADPFVVVVHPAASLPGAVWRGAIPGIRAETGISLATSEKQQAILLRDLAESCRRGLILVHVLLNTAQSALTHAQEMLAATNARGIHSQGTVHTNGEPEWKEFRSPLVFGVHHQDRGVIHWFFALGRQTDAESLSKEGATGWNLPSAIPLDWRDLAALFPAYFRLEHRADGRSRLIHDLPEKLSASTLKSAVSLMLGLMVRSGETYSGAWLWRGERGKGVRTSSGSLTSRYLSTYNLCVAEPVVQRAFELLLQEALPEGDDEVIIAPESEGASYLLAKRLSAGVARHVAVVHPDSLGKLIRSRPTPRVVVFSDSIYSGGRLLAFLERMPHGANCVSTIVVLDLNTAQDRGQLIAALGGALVSLGEVPSAQVSHDSEDGSLAEDRSVDGLTNSVVSKEALAQSRQYCSLLWNDPTSRGTPGAAQVDLEALEFGYGVQLVGGKYHLVRCYTAKALQDSNLRTTLALRIARRCLASEPEHDILLVARDESHVVAHLREIGGRLQRELRNRVFVAVVGTTRRGGKQVLDYNLRTLLDSARRCAVTGDAVEAGAAESFQFSLFHVEELNESIEAGFTLVFIDNAAVSGNTGRQLALSSVRAPAALRPQKVLLFALVTKLSPYEEAFLHAVDVHSETELCGDSGAWEALRVEFAALVQLRVRSYTTCQELKLSRQIENVASRSQDCGYERLRSWGSAIRARLRDFQAATEPAPLQFPWNTADLPKRSVPREVAHLRHLIAVFQQGFPVGDEVQRQFRVLVDSREYSALLVFALEPDLVEDSLLYDIISTELVELALLCLRGEQDVGLRASALAALHAIPSLFVRESGNICRSCLVDHEVSTVWLGLTCCGLDPANRMRAIAESLAVLDESSERALSEETAAALEILRAEKEALRAEEPSSVAQARSSVIRFMQQSRTHHSGRGFGRWWRVHQIVEEMRRSAAFRPDALTFSQFGWGEVGGYIRQTVIPVIMAAKYLARQGHLHHADLFRSAERTTLNAFEMCKAAAIRVERRAAPFRELLDAWSSLVKSTLSTSVDLLFSQQTESILGEADPGEPATLDYFLLEIVADPVAVILHALAAELGRDTHVAFQHRISRSSACSLARDGALGLALPTLGDKWRTEPSVKVAWFCSEPIRKVSQILAGNVRTHGDARQLDLSVYVEETLRRLRIEVRNRIKFSGTPGTGTGLENARAAARLFDGSLRVREVDGLFCATLSIPVSSVQLTKLIDI